MFVRKNYKRLVEMNVESKKMKDEVMISNEEDSSSDLQTAVYEDGEEQNIGAFMDGMGNTSQMWSKMSMGVVRKMSSRISDANVIKRYRLTIRSLAGVLPKEVTQRNVYTKLVCMFLVPYLVAIILYSWPACTPWTHNYDGAYDYVSPDDCARDDVGVFYFLNILALAAIIPSSSCVFEKLFYLKYLNRVMSLLEYAIPLGITCTVGAIFIYIYMQVLPWDYPPFFNMMVLFSCYPFVVFSYIVTLALERKHFSKVPKWELIKMFVVCQIINSASFMVTFASYAGFQIAYNYLQRRRHTFQGFESFLWYMMSTFGMTVLRELNMKEQKWVYNKFDPSAIPMGQSFILFVHCAFLSGLRASSAIDHNYVGLVLLSVTDIIGIMGATARLAFRVDPMGMLKRKLGFGSDITQEEADQGMIGVNFIVEKAMYMITEELVECVVPAIYILIDFTVWFMPNKNLIAGIGVSAFGLQKPEDQTYLFGLLIVLLAEIISFGLLLWLLKSKCQIDLYSALMLFIYNDGTYCIWFGLFAIITQNVFRYTPLGCDLTAKLYWMYP